LAANPARLKPTSALANLSRTRGTERGRPLA
jgi:hypothetical protein